MKKQIKQEKFFLKNLVIASSTFGQDKAIFFKLRDCFLMLK
jgi:hypothetical protein